MIVFPAGSCVFFIFSSLAQRKTSVAEHIGPGHETVVVRDHKGKQLAHFFEVSSPAQYLLLGHAIDEASKPGNNQCNVLRENSSKNLLLTFPLWPQFQSKWRMSHAQCREE